MLFSGCGIQIETIAQSPIHLVAPPADLGPSPAASQIFAPCVSGKAEPLKNAASAIADLLIGKDQYRTDCAPNPDTSVPLYSKIERAPRTLNPEPVDPHRSAMLVTDELVGAVLTGTGEYWYQPVIGPA
ncbi:hypothetical protein L2K20_21390 [Mycobacterium sp. MBM]|nr:hypothetical protein [Mycobacterium sp. MBM]